MKQRFLASLVALAAATLPHLSGQIATSAQKKPVAVSNDLAPKTKAAAHRNDVVMNKDKATAVASDVNRTTVPVPSLKSSIMR